MTILNRNEITSNLGTSIIIHPFEDKNLKGIGYNFRVGPLAWSANSKKPLDVIEKDGRKFFLVEPNDVALVITRETISVDSTIAGTFHSKVDKVCTGFSHISTTLDANWCGPLLIAIANNKGSTLDLRIDDTFTTLIFYKIEHTEYKHHNPSGRTDIIRALGLNADDNEHKWLSEEWRHNVNALKDHYEQSIHDDDTFAILDRKVMKRRTVNIRRHEGLKYFIQLLILIVFALAGYVVFKSAEGVSAASALGFGIIAYTKQYVDKILKIEGT